MGRKIVFVGIVVTVLFALPASVNPEMEPYSLRELPLPKFPERSMSRQVSPTVKKYVADLPIDRGQPGSSSRVWVYLPMAQAGSTEAKVPCLFYTTAGAPIFGGALLSAADELEVMPYVNLGFAVVCYEVDGDLEITPQTTPEQMVEAAETYFASSAGLVNARNAMQFALKRFPEIDSERMFTIGHSSAGKQALLWLAHEPKLKGCVAFAPAAKLSLQESMAMRGFPTENSSNFIAAVRRSMPIRHASRIQAPVLVIHSKSDMVVSSSQLRRFARKTGEHVELVEVEGCSHFDLPADGFSIASNWLRKAAFPNAPRPPAVLPSNGRNTMPVTDAGTAARSMPPITPVRRQSRKPNSITVNPYVD